MNNNFTTTGVNGKTLNSSTQTLNAGKQTVVIPKDVILKDATGAPVTGTLKSEIVFFDPTSAAAQNAIPGTLSVDATMSNGNAQNIKFRLHLIVNHKYMP